MAKIQSPFKYIRVKREIKANVFAKTIEITTVFLSKIESGEKNPSFPTIHKMINQLESTLPLSNDEKRELSEYYLFPKK